MTARWTSCARWSGWAPGSCIGIFGRWRMFPLNWNPATRSASSGRTAREKARCCRSSPASCPRRRGDCFVNGKVSALLELGSGFNPEFTGRENVFMNGAILGLDTRQMEQRFDAIAAFAEIGDFMEQPVKTYSSGMFMRLAFAVAVNVDPDILLVDEALSVGDLIFQHRCMHRMNHLREHRKNHRAGHP